MDSGDGVEDGDEFDYEENVYEITTALNILSFQSDEWINISKYQYLETLTFSTDVILYTLPDFLPSTITTISCSRNKLISLSESLPSSLQELRCYKNQLTSLPNNLPSSLQYLECSSNQLTSLPNNLPASLQTLNCDYNHLTALPDNLPSSLQYLRCSHNKITFLPDILPSSLKHITCNDNQIQYLPDIPSTVVYIYAFRNPLIANYHSIDHVHTISREYATEINNFNQSMRRDRCRLINKDNVLLEIYMKKMMHPDRLRELRDDESIDVDEFMEKYVGSL